MRQSPAIRSAKARRNAKAKAEEELNKRLQIHYEAGYAAGQLTGIREGRQSAADEIRIAERKANIELARNLGQMVEAVARAVAAMTTEKGLVNDK